MRPRWWPRISPRRAATKSDAGSVKVRRVVCNRGEAEPAPSGADDQVPGAPDPEAELVDFTRYVVNDVNATWTQIFAQAGDEYRDAGLVLFREGVQTGCGAASSAGACAAGSHAATSSTAERKCARQDGENWRCEVMTGRGGR